uniref:protein-tyrosine-phosphatase n=1 Tax=Desulfobacca acetoxidans TaxID=60893 RepID=A0A7C3V2I0_9BACT
MIDLHAHILPGIDDGPRSLEDALEMARLAAADGITTMVATPHLFRRKSVELNGLNHPETIRQAVRHFQEKLAEEQISLTILPGCESPLFPEIIKFVDDQKILTINDLGRYLCLEMPETVIPPAVEDLVFQLNARGITPIITHPERNLVFYEMPEKLRRLISLGCLAQITARSLTRGFGWGVARFTKKLVREGLVHLMATDAHSVKNRPPLMEEAFKKLRKLVGQSRAWDMVATVPERIIRGEPVL